VKNNAQAESLRLFYALWPDDDTRDALTRLQAHVTGKRSRPENLHLTLAFLGEQPVSLLPVLESLMHELPSEPIALVIDKFGYFRRAEIAWAGPSEVPLLLTELHRSLQEELRSKEIFFDDTAQFRPHVTLARKAAPLEAIAFPPLSWKADRFTLVQSTTSPSGVEYRILHELCFRKA
jgi:2'-5' RNA ligase